MASQSLIQRYVARGLARLAKTPEQCCYHFNEMASVEDDTWAGVAVGVGSFTLRNDDSSGEPGGIGVISVGAGDAASHNYVHGGISQGKMDFTTPSASQFFYAAGRLRCSGAADGFEGFSLGFRYDEAVHLVVAQTAVIRCQNSAAGFFELAYRSQAGAIVTAASPVAGDTAWHTVELWFPGFGTTLYGSVDGNVVSLVLPAVLSKEMFAYVGGKNDTLAGGTARYQFGVWIGETT